MPVAVGVIETLGFPAILAASDAMLKGGRVTLVYFDKAEKGNFYVAIRGPISEVNTAMAAGLASVEEVFGGQVMSHYIVPNPPENVVEVLPIAYTEESEPFRV
ncbi:MAG: carbon dioxide-concentrating mechanism protein CcmK [Cyanobacteria bacterium]|nr:carbon dioxide-concentrating mechanism protein CcmK [Cyanobacteriota bacterium]